MAKVRGVEKWRKGLEGYAADDKISKQEVQTATRVIKVKLAQKGLILIFVPLVFEVFFVLGFGNLLQQSIEKLEAEVHAKEVLACIARAEMAILDTEIITFVLPIYRTPEMRARYEALWQTAESEMNTLEKLFEHAPNQKLNFSRCRASSKFIRPVQEAQWFPDEKHLQIAQKIQQELSVYDPSKPGDFEFQYDKFMKEHNYVSLSQIAAVEFYSIKQVEGLRERIKQHFVYFLFFGILANLSITIGLAIYFGKNIEKRFRNLMENTSRLSAGKELLVPAKGADEIAKLEMALHQTSSKFLEMQKFRKQLLGIVCHELKAPLSGVQILLSLLSEGTYGQLSKEAKQTAQRAENNSRRLQRIVSNLLDLEIIGLDKTRIEKQPVELDEVLQSSEEMVRGLAEEKGVILDVQLFHESLSADPDRLLQVIMNLLSNAIKYSPPGSTVTVATTKTKDWLELTVSDQGAGIAEDMHTAIFEAFQQAEQPKNPGIKGTGLGLAICKSIVEEHGGSIGVRSAPGKGSSFWIRLPLNSQNGNKRESAQPPAPQNLRPTRKGFRHKGFLLIGLPFAIQLIFTGVLSGLLGEANHEIEQQMASREIVLYSQMIVQAFLGIESQICEGGTDNVQFRNLYNQNQGQIAQLLPLLYKATNKDPVRLSSTVTMDKYVKELIPLLIELRKYINDPSATNKDAARKFLADQYLLTSTVRQISDREEKLQARLYENSSIIKQHIQNALLAGLCMNFATAIFLMAFLSRNIVTRISNVAENAERMLNRKSLLPPLTGDDEIEQLDLFLHDTAQKLTDEQRLKQRMVAIASHELRAPLTAIKGSLNLLSAGALGELPAGARNRIDLAEKGTERLIHLINDLLDIEKMEAGKSSLNLIYVPGKNLVDDAIVSLATIASEKDIRLENNVEEIEILADPDKLLQVLINLISNAIKFSPAGKPVIIASKKMGDSLTIYVRDFGIGISGEEQEKIFHPFGIKQAAQKELNPSGTGLGLAISKAIIEQHGGSIGVDSTPGDGSIFWLRLHTRNDDEITH